MPSDPSPAWQPAQNTSSLAPGTRRVLGRLGRGRVCSCHTGVLWSGLAFCCDPDMPRSLSWHSLWNAHKEIVMSISHWRRKATGGDFGKGWSQRCERVERQSQSTGKAQGADGPGAVVCGGDRAKRLGSRLPTPTGLGEAVARCRGNSPEPWEQRVWSQRCSHRLSAPALPADCLVTWALINLPQP